MAAKNITFGMGGVFMPPAELNAQAVQRYEKSGIDFVAYWDQICMTFPRSIWTPDIVPAAATYDIIRMRNGMAPLGAVGWGTNPFRGLPLVRQIPVCRPLWLA